MNCDSRKILVIDCDNLLASTDTTCTRGYKEVEYYYLVEAMPIPLGPHDRREKGWQCKPEWQEAQRNHSRKGKR